MNPDTTQHVCMLTAAALRRLLYGACLLTMTLVIAGQASAQHSITTAPGAGGRIFPSGPITVPEGAKPTFFIIPDAGFSIQDVMVNSESQGKGSQVQVGPVTAATVVAATFVKSPTITSSATGTGTITPSGKDTVGNGGSRTYIMQAAPGSMLNSLLVNGVSVALPDPKPSLFSYTVENITETTTIKAAFALDPSKVLLTSTAAAGGGITPLGKVEALKGSSKTYLISPNSGYYIKDVKVNGKSVGMVSSNTLTDIQKAQTVAATFAKRPVVTAKQAAGGSITPSTPVTANYNGSVFYSFSPQSGYMVDKILVNGQSHPGSSGFSVTGIKVNTTVTAVFKLQEGQFLISATAAAGGMISPAGKVAVSSGGSRSFTITPAAGHRILDVKVDGQSVGAVSSHSITNVLKNGTITATFAKNPTITAKQAIGGSISPAGVQSVSLNGSRTYSITPQTGFEILNLVVDGKKLPPLGSHTFSSVTKNQTISAIFKQRTDYVALTTLAGKGGTALPAGKTLVPKGSSPTVNLTPDINFQVLDVKVGKLSQGSVLSVAVEDIQADTVVTASFTKLPLITAKQSVGGAVGPAGNKVVAMGGSQTYNINPEIGYKLDYLLVDGKKVDDVDGIYEFTNVTKNRTIGAKFSLTTHVVEASSPPGGTIVPSGTLNVQNGKDQSFKVTPPAGFKAGIRVNGVLKAQAATGGELTYVLKKVRKNHRVEAVYAPLGTQFAGTLGITPVGLGDTIHVANKSPANFQLLTNGTLGVAGVFYHNVSATNWGEASPGATDDDWTVSVPMVLGDNEIWFAAVGNDGDVAWYPTLVTYYPQTDFTTPLTPYVSNQPLSSLTVGSPTAVTWKLGLLGPEGAVVTLYSVNEQDELTVAVQMRDNGTLPDEIEGDGIFTGNTTITANTAGYLYYRAGVVKPGPVTYYSETKEVWAPPPLTNDMANTAGELADEAALQFETQITGGMTVQEAAEFVAALLRQDPDIGAAGTTEEGGVWWVTEDGLLGFYHTTYEDQRAGAVVDGGGRGGPAPVLDAALAANPAQTPFYSPKDWETLFPKVQQAVTMGIDGPITTLAAAEDNRILSDRAVLISPFLNNPNGSSFGNGDDYYKPWPTIKAHKTCGLYAEKEALNNGSVSIGLADFKNLSNFGYIHICTHGDNLYNGLLTLWKDEWGPNDFLKGNLSIVGIYCGIKLPKVDGKYVLGVHADDLNQKRLAIGPGGLLVMLPKFFKDYLQPLPNSLVSLAACRTGYNGSLMSVFLSKGAGAVIGYTDYVSCSYCQNTLQEVIDRMYEDKTFIQAAQSAVSKYGANDADTDPAAFVYMGATDLKFPNSELANRGFEDGIIAPWQVAGDGRVITGLGIERPKEGKFMGIISTGLGYTTSSGSIQQRFCVPDSGAVMGFRWSFYSEEWLEYVGSQYQDAFSVSIAVVDPVTGAVGGFTTLFNKTIDGLAGQVIPADVGFDQGGVYKTTWRMDTLNLHTYSGKTVVLRFSCTDVGDSIYDSAILLDDIQILPGMAPAP
jgi:hypothetical protein